MDNGTDIYVGFFPGKNPGSGIGAQQGRICCKKVHYREKILAISGDAVFNHGQPGKDQDIMARSS
jgi:hypothetical protein